MKNLIVIFVFLLFTIQAASQEKQFQKACALNTIEGFDKFIDKYPSSKFIQEVEFRRTNLINTSEAYEGFIKKYPGGNFSDQTKDALCNLEYNKIEQSDNIDLIKFYLNKYTYCNSHIDEIRKKLADLEIRRVEESDFNETKQTNTIGGYQTFLKEFPNGFYKHDAEKAIEKFEFDKIEKSTTSFFYELYLALHPNSNFKKEIENLIYDINKWNEAKKTDWYSSYQIYIDTSPNGSYIDSAIQKINWLKSQKAEFSADIPSLVKGAESKYSNVSSPVFSWEVTFHENGGKIGYRIKGVGWYIDGSGSYYGNDNHSRYSGLNVIETRQILIGPGENYTYSSWLSGTNFINGSIELNFIGEDAGGHLIEIPVKINLR